MDFDAFSNFLGDLSRTAKSGKKAVRVGKRALRNFDRLDAGQRTELGKMALGSAATRVLAELVGPEVRVVRPGDEEDDE